MNVFFPVISMLTTDSKLCLSEIVLYLNTGLPDMVVLSCTVLINRKIQLFN